MKHSRASSSAGARAWALAAALSAPLLAACSGDDAASTNQETGTPPKLCSLSLTCAQPIIDASKRSCEFSVVDGTGARLYDSFAGVEIRGRSSQAFPKKNYSIELRSANTTDAPENPTNLLDMGRESDWVLDGSWADRSFSRNALVFDSFRDLRAQDWAPQSRLCTLNLNEQAQGIYRVVEKVKRDDDRVDIAADDGTGSSFVIKQDDDGIVDMPLGQQNKWKLVYPNQETATPAQIAGVQSFLDKLKSALAASASSDASTGVFALLDFENVVDWVLVQEFAKNIDAYNLSVHCARSASGKAFMIPWDIDLSLGQPIVKGDPNSANNEKPEGFVVHRTEFISNLTKVSAFKARLGTRWRELRQSALTESALLAKLDRYETTLDPARVAENFTIWPIDKIDYVQIYAPYSLPKVASHAEEMTALRAFISARLVWIDAHIDTYPN